MENQMLFILLLFAISELQNRGAVWDNFGLLDMVIVCPLVIITLSSNVNSVSFGIHINIICD
jgi:hypothetical protein